MRPAVSRKLIHRKGDATVNTRRTGGRAYPLMDLLEGRALLSASIGAIASFNLTNGTNPVGELVRDAAGNLYGTTKNGGASGAGTIFEIKAGSTAITTLASFNGTNGRGPQAGLALDSA